MSVDDANRLLGIGSNAPPLFSRQLPDRTVIRGCSAAVVLAKEWQDTDIESVVQHHNVETETRVVLYMYRCLLEYQLRIPEPIHPPHAQHEVASASWQQR